MMDHHQQHQEPQHEPAAGSDLPTSLVQARRSSVRREGWEFVTLEALPCNGPGILIGEIEMVPMNKVVACCLCFFHNEYCNWDSGYKYQAFEAIICH